MTPARRLTLLFSACALAAGGLVAREGWVTKAYPDPAVGSRRPTACAGVTAGVRLGKRYSEGDCVQMTALAMVQHAGPIMDCVPVDTISPQTLSVFADFAYNAGPAAFCKSTMSKRAMAGDMKGACDALLLWYRAGGRDCRTDRRCRGVWVRRQQQRADCLRGLSDAPA